MARVASLDFGISVDAKRLDRGLKQARRRFRTFTRTMKREFGGLAKAGAGAATAIGAGFVVAAQQALQHSDKVIKTARSVGIQAERYQELTFALGQMGIEQEKANKLFLRVAQLQFEVERGTKTYTDALSRMGVNLKDVVGVPVEQALKVMGDALKEAKGDTGALGAASLALGARLVGLLGTYTESSDQVEKLAEDLRYTGGVIRADLLPNAESINDAFDLAGKTIRAQFTNALLSGLGPAGDVRDVIKAVGEAVFTATNKFIAFGRQLIDALPTLIKIAKWLIVIKSVLAGVTLGATIGTLFGGPLGTAIGGAIGGVAGGAGALFAIGQIQELIGELGGSVSTADTQWAQLLQDLGKGVRVPIEVVPEQFREAYTKIADQMGVKLKEAAKEGVSSGITEGGEQALQYGLHGARDLAKMTTSRFITTDPRVRVQPTGEGLHGFGDLGAIETPGAYKGRIQPGMGLGKDGIAGWWQARSDEFKQSIMDFGMMVRENLRQALLSGNFKDLGKAFLQSLQAALIDSLLSNLGKGLMSVLKGGGFLAGITGKATGGSVYAGRAYTVGERGVERFIPGRNGTIIPNHELRGGMAAPITVNNPIKVVGDVTRQTRSVLRRDAENMADLLAQANRERGMVS